MLEVVFTVKLFLFLMFIASAVCVKLCIDDYRKGK